MFRFDGVPQKGAITKGMFLRNMAIPRKRLSIWISSSFKYFFFLRMRKESFEVIVIKSPERK